MSDGHLAWTYPGVAVSGMFMGYDTQTGLAYVKTRAGLVNFSQPANLRGQLARVAPGTAITITFRRLQNGQKMFRVTPHDVDVGRPQVRDGDPTSRASVRRWPAPETPAGGPGAATLSRVAWNYRRDLATVA